MVRFCEETYRFVGILHVLSTRHQGGVRSDAVVPCRTIPVGGVRFHSACAASHYESRDFFRNYEYTRSLCSKLLSCSCIWGNWKLEIGNTNDRMTIIDLSNFLKPCDRVAEI
jgi:hypothetical protein